MEGRHCIAAQRGDMRPNDSKDFRNKVVHKATKATVLNRGKGKGIIISWSGVRLWSG